ncbi:hypothetical protein ACLX1H_002880 [Fusarium chlamydosporum]
MANPSDQEQQPKTRKRHNRSRMGCMTCKNKHVRCDEQRPVCGNCATTSQSCEYAGPVLPLRERRKSCLPGEQQPWAVAVEPVSKSPPKAISPARPTHLPLHSLELFHYFHEVGNNYEVPLRDKRQNLLAQTMHYPDALSNTLLIAGFHYVVNVGKFNSFKPTLLLHKIETIRSVNKWLQCLEPKSYAMCVRQISTLCITECYLGNSVASETHLNGLMKFMDIYGPLGKSNPAEPSITAELSMRYIIFTYSFISACKSRVLESPPDVGEATGSKIATMHERYYVEAGGLNLKLKTMEMLPYFFAPLSSIIGFRHIDASRTVDSLLALTEICQLGVSIKGLNPILRRMWLEGAATKLILAAVETHMDSLCGYGDKTRDREMPLGMESSWSGIHIAAELYLHQVLRLWNVGGLLEVNFHLHILAYLSWDLAKSEGVLDAGPIATSKLWLWKAFVGAGFLEV